MRIFALFLLFLFSQSSLALDLQLSLKLGKADRALSAIEHILQKKIETDIELLNKYHVDSLAIQILANQCIDSNEFSINKSADDLELLGPQAVPEEALITQKRVSLNKNMLSSAQQLASCRLLLLRVQETIKSSADQQQTLIESKLFMQRTNIIDHIQFNLSNPLLVLDNLKSFLVINLEIDFVYRQKYQLLGILLFSMLLSLVIKKWLRNSLNKKQYNKQMSLGGQVQFSLLSCTNHYLPSILSSGLLALYLSLNSQSDSGVLFLTTLMLGLSFLSILIWLVRVFLNPCEPAKLFINIDSNMSILLTRRLRIFIWLLFIGFLLFFVTNTSNINDQVLGLIRNVYMAFVVLNLIWVTWLLGRLNMLANTTLFRLLLSALLLVSLVSDWLGFANFAFFILLGLSGSILLLLIGLFISRLFSDFLDGFDEGRYQWQKNTRKVIGVKTDEFIPGAIWLRFAGIILIWSFILVVVLKVWGLSDSSLLELRSLVLDGFTLGSIHIIPTRVLISLLSFSIMISIIGWVKRRLDKSWLKRSRMDRGSKEAMISLTGYFGMAMALLITLSVAGVQLANLAIIAGALSVGIGFGLQNIVNNFVSGVILLFERPIKTGDWISVGGTEGYVRKISIRSTQIQTFDRSDVLVPNSELISGQVTNWMLKDSRGRLIVPVGVGYGTDPEKVRAILLGIAENHDQVIKNSPILSNPYVLFREFADSSLNFELRCFLVNVDSRLRVLSDINFAINKEFIKANIEIPFPQRDINIKQMSSPDTDGLDQS